MTVSTELYTKHSIGVMKIKQDRKIENIPKILALAVLLLGLQSHICLGQDLTEELSESFSEDLNQKEEGGDQTPLTICIRSNNKWVGFTSPNKVYYALIDQNKTCVVTYKEASLTEQEVIILNRFLKTRGLLNDLKKNEEISNKQIEIITGVTKNNKKDPKSLNIEEILEKTTHISIWDGEDFSELTLGTTAEAKKHWPQLLPNFLKVLYEPSSRAEKIKVEGIGFIVPVDKPRRIGEQISWASTLRSMTYTFEKVTNETFDGLPDNLQRMLKYNGFIVPLSTEDLKRMTKLKWEEYPEDIAETTGIPLDQSAMIWWGLIDYKGKNYGINAWTTCND